MALMVCTLKTTERIASSVDAVFTETPSVPSLLEGARTWKLNWFLWIIPYPTVEFTFENHCWQKQEVLKGMATLAGTLSGGWGFYMDEYVQPLSPLPVTIRHYTAKDAANLTPDQLRAVPVFNPRPSSMTNSVIPLLVRAAHLTHGIPALTPPTGRTTFEGLDFQGRSFDCNLAEEVARPNSWPLMRRYATRWTHSDMKDVAYYYIWKFYEKVIEKGQLK